MLIKKKMNYEMELKTKYKDEGIVYKPVLLTIRWFLLMLKRVCKAKIMGGFHHYVINFKVVRASNIRVGAFIAALLLLWKVFSRSALQLSHRNSSHFTLFTPHFVKPWSSILHNYLLLKMNNFVCDKWCVYSIRPIKIG